MHARWPSGFPDRIPLVALALLLLSPVAGATNRQFNTFTAPSPQPPPINAAAETLETCPSCEPPKKSRSVAEDWCVGCGSGDAVPAPLAPDCNHCAGDQDSMHDTAPFTTVIGTCPDCEPAELHPRVGWDLESERTGTGVYLANGDLFHRQVDFDIPGRGFSFQFVRRHVTGVTYDGPLGKGWDFTYNMRIVVDGDGDALLHDGTGRVDEFDESSGTYSTPAGRFEELIKEGSPSKFKLKTPHATVYQFDASGTNCRLESITDRAGNVMSFSYDGSSRLSSVTDTLERTISLSYDGDGRITSVTDFDSRTWGYAYTSGRLTSVTSPGVTGFTSGKVTTYGYDGDKLDTLTDPKSQLVLDATWTSGKVTTLRYGASGENFTFSYDSSTQTTVTDRNGNETVVTLSAAGQPTRIVEKTNRNVRAGEGDYTTDYSFNSDRLLTRIDLPAGNAITYAYQTGAARARSNMVEELLRNDSDDTWTTNAWTYDSTVNLVKTFDNRMVDDWDTDEVRTTYSYDHEEATLGDLNGDSSTSGTDGVVVKIVHPKISTQTPNLTPSETFRYNANGQVTRWDRVDGEVTTFEYHASGAQTGYLKKRKDDDTVSGLQLTTEWAYDAVGNITSITSPRGFATLYTVNDLNQVTKIETPLSSTVTYDTIFEYDANDNLVKKEVENLDGDGASVTANPWITTTWTFSDVLNRCTARTDEINTSQTAQTSFTYDANRNLLQITRPAGSVIAHSYDERDLLYRRTRGTTEPSKSIEEWTYDANRNEIEHESGAGNVHASAYDDWDRRVTVLDPAGTQEEMSYDAMGRLTSRGKAAGVDFADEYELTEVRYNGIGKPSRVRRKYFKNVGDSATDFDTNFEYRKDGQVSKVVVTRATSPSTVTLATTSTFDAAGRLVEMEDEAGNTTTFTRDADGNITREERLDKAQAGSSYDETIVTEWAYDRRGQKLSETRDPGTGKLNLTVSWKRDSRGNIVQQTDGRGNKQDMTYDGRGLLLSRTEDLRGSTRTTTEYTYDSNGNRTGIENDNGHSTTYTFDALDRRTRRTNADSTYIEWTYDDDDVVTGWTDENGTVVVNTLDDLGRVIERDITRATGVEGTTNEEFAYDANGRLTSAKDDDSVVTLKWDSFGRIHEESIGWGNPATVTRTVKRDYDLTGNVTKVTYPDNTAIDYVIDADSDRIDQVKDGSNVVADYRWVGGRVDKLDYLNGVVRATTFDDVARITEIDHVKSGTSRAKFTYTHDANDNVLTERRGHNSNLYEVFSYDKRNQLDTVWYDATTSSSPTVYSVKDEQLWDGAYNLDTRSRTVYGQSGVTVDYTANSRNQYTGIGGDTPDWSDNGELVDDGHVQSYNYDYEGRLTKVTRGASTYTFKYDALGRRISTNFGTELRFTWAGDRILEEITSAGTPVVNAQWVWGVDPEPLRMNRGGTLSYYHANRAGSVEKLTDTSGTVVESVEYEAFGKPSIASSGRGNHFLWLAAPYDFLSGLYQDGSASFEPTVSLRRVAAVNGSVFSVSSGLSARTALRASALTPVSTGRQARTSPRPRVEGLLRARVAGTLRYSGRLSASTGAGCPRTMSGDDDYDPDSEPGRTCDPGDPEPAPKEPERTPEDINPQYPPGERDPCIPVGGGGCFDRGDCCPGGTCRYGTCVRATQTDPQPRPA